MTEPVAETHSSENAPGAARLIVLSDGVYAIAMTLLVINVTVPAHLDDVAFHKALGGALPNIGAFALSFALIAGFWRDHRRILTALSTETAVITRLVLLGLGLVALLPFPTALLAEYASQPEAVALYAGAMARSKRCTQPCCCSHNAKCTPHPHHPPPRPAAASRPNSVPAF